VGTNETTRCWDWATSLWAMKASRLRGARVGEARSAGWRGVSGRRHRRLYAAGAAENADRIILIDAASDGNPIGTSLALRRASRAITRLRSQLTMWHERPAGYVLYTGRHARDCPLCDHHRSSAANPDESFARRGDCGCRRRGAHFGGVTGRRRRGSVASGSKFPFAFTRSSGYHNCYGR